MVGNRDVLFTLKVCVCGTEIAFNVANSNAAGKFKCWSREGGTYFPNYLEAVIGIVADMTSSVVGYRKVHKEGEREAKFLIA